MGIQKLRNMSSRGEWEMLVQFALIKLEAYMLPEHDSIMQSSLPSIFIDPISLVWICGNAIVPRGE
jgi:hypothetical protein